MDNLAWGYFVLGLIVYQIGKMTWMVFNAWVIKHRQEKFLRLVSVLFPDNSKITFVSIDTSDRLDE